MLRCVSLSLSLWQIGENWCEWGVFLLSIAPSSSSSSSSRILTADFHAAEGWRLSHGLAALREGRGPGPAWHPPSPQSRLKPVCKGIKIRLEPWLLISELDYWVKKMEDKMKERWGGKDEGKKTRPVLSTRNQLLVFLLLPLLVFPVPLACFW